MSIPNPSHPFLVNGAGSPQSIYEASEIAYHDLGTRGVTTDGRVFYYASRTASGTLARGSLCTRAATVSTHLSITYASGGAAGSNKVTVTLGATNAVTANQYADGWFMVIDEAAATSGQGQLRKIASHPAANAAATLELTLYDPFEEAVANTSTECSIVSSNYAAVIVSPGNAQPIPVGVPQFDVPAGDTDTQYFWIQTYGEALVLGDGSAFTDGAGLVPAGGATADAGQVTLALESEGTGSKNDPTDLLPLVGYVIEANDATSDVDHRFAFLTIRA